MKWKEGNEETRGKPCHKVATSPNIPDDSLNFQLHFVKLLTAHHVRQAKAKVHMSRKFRALDQLKSYCTKFPLLPLASILTRSFARLNNTTFTLSKPRTTVPTFHGLRPKQVTPPYGGGSIARFHRNRNLANGEQCRERGPPT